MILVHSFGGSASQCGRAYGREFQRELAGFFSQEFGAYKYSEKFVKACLRKMKRQAPQVAKFMQGLSSASLLSINQLTLLLLHEEELYHRRLKKQWPHCTAVGLAGNRRGQGTLVGQNWDWATSYFPWSSLLHLKINNHPRILSLAYPGLPVCCGVNSAGLSLMWSGSGYYPPILPKVGVPTYALVFETLLKRNVPAAIRYLRQVENSGAFMFVLGDAEGRLAIVEGVPGKIFVQTVDRATRSNVFELHACARAGRQKLPREKRCHSLLRNRVLAESFCGAHQPRGVMGVKRVLSQKHILIEQRHAHATLWQVIADCKRRRLHVRPWRQIIEPWTELRA
ncbi:MAG: C45 family peptidase [Oligoflexia bacterium]|nr:C45 family peptidase [Oligoflexia bacterium]